MKRLRIEGRFAVFSDVHGNLPALEAILADIEARSLPLTLCLGERPREAAADAVPQQWL